MVKLHPNTVKFANVLYGIAALWMLAGGALLVGGYYGGALSLVLVPLALRIALQQWTHKRVYPFRNRIVSTHMLRALDASGWLAWRAAQTGRPVRILDFGCGMGDTSNMLRGMLAQGAGTAADKDEVDITSVDVYRSERWVGGPSTRVVYDGNLLPFRDAEFDLAVAGQVLHHIPDNETSTRELCRVATHVLVVEDLVRRGTGQETFCHFWDSLWNWDFFQGVGTPHTNREHEEWLGLFEQCDMDLQHFHATSFAFKKDVVTDDLSEFKALANGCYVIKKRR